MSIENLKTIPSNMMPALQGIIPTCMTTCSTDGIPNVTYISQVWYVDEKHLAISCQFFNKTTRNVRANPPAAVITTCPETFAMWRVHMRFSRSETSGRLYEDMATQLEAIASMVGMQDVFRLISADVYEVDSVEVLYPGSKAV